MPLKNCLDYIAKSMLEEKRFQSYHFDIKRIQKELLHPYTLCSRSQIKKITNCLLEKKYSFRK